MVSVFVRNININFERAAIVFSLLKTAQISSISTASVTPELKQ